MSAPLARTYVHIITHVNYTYGCTYIRRRERAENSGGGGILNNYYLSGFLARAKFSSQTFRPFRPPTTAVIVVVVTAVCCLFLYRCRSHLFLPSTLKPLAPGCFSAVRGVSFLKYNIIYSANNNLGILCAGVPGSQPTSDDFKCSPHPAPHTHTIIYYIIYFPPPLSFPPCTLRAARIPLSCALSLTLSRTIYMAGNPTSSR